MPSNVKGLNAPNLKSKPTQGVSKKHTATEDKDAFKKLVEKKKANLKTPPSIAKIPPDKTKNLNKEEKASEKTTDKTKHPHISPNSPLAKLLDKKAPLKSTESKGTHPVGDKSKDKAPLNFAQQSKAFEKANALKKNSAKLSDIKQLDSAKQLNLAKIQHESKPGESTAKNQGTETQTQAPTQTPNPSKVDAKPDKMSTADLLALKNNPPTTPKAPTQTTPKQTPNPAEVSKPPTQTPKLATPPTTPTPSTPLGNLLNKSPVPTPSSHVIKDSHTNDRDIKQAFEEAFEGPLRQKPAIIPLSFNPNHLPLQSPGKPPTPPKDTSEEIKTSSIETPNHSMHNAQVESQPSLQAPQIKETLKNFATILRQELLDFKPPITKLSIELNPDNLGKVEVVIQQVGKNIQVSVASSPPVSALLATHQSELRQNLAQMGFNDVDLRFNAQNDTGGSSAQQNLGQNPGQHPQQQQNLGQNPNQPQQSQPQQNIEPPTQTPTLTTRDQNTPPSSTQIPNYA
ncbi:flagellar hook-length control protein FliK [Helicobacter suis]|uniref:flagellar hook-length control protein FliK n=1 Tax=Helicobacter suis TaxID=104628 RepID=UPI0013D7BB88|nr:flagellar hook-length control protein FliK [Helicobacter suis]